MTFGSESSKQMDGDLKYNGGGRPAGIVGRSGGSRRVFERQVGDLRRGLIDNTLSRLSLTPNR